MIHNDTKVYIFIFFLFAAMIVAAIQELCAGREPKKKEEKAKAKGRLYWFGRNMAAWIIGIPFYPLLMIVDFLWLTTRIFVTDGSVRIQWPWKWKWWGKH
jgi:hypothetical protein